MKLEWIYHYHLGHASLLIHFSRVWFFATLCTVVYQAPLSMGFSRQEYWRGFPCPPPGDLPDPGIKLVSLMSPALAGGFFITSATWQAIVHQFQFQFSRSVVSDSLWPHELQHTRSPCPSPTSGVYPNSCPLSRWCHPAISSSVFPFSSHPQSFPASGSFQMSQLFISGGQSIWCMDHGKWNES